MFFILGIHEKEKKLDYDSPLLIHSCGKYGRYEVTMTYLFLHLFFLPLWKWNKKYYVKALCCQRLYQLDPSVGQAIERGEEVSIGEEDLTPLDTYSGPFCPHCHRQLEEGFAYCPYCGQPM